jgi:hypothetical protein
LLRLSNYSALLKTPIKMKSSVRRWRQTRTRSSTAWT